MKHLKGNEAWVALVAAWLLAGVLSPDFLAWANLRNILNQASILGLLACAEFLVVLIGGFDLSVAAVMALGSVIFATLAPGGLILAGMAALGAGVVMGALSGVSVTLGRVPPMIATLGVMGIARSMAFLVSEKSVAVPAALIEPIKTAGPLGSTVLVWALLALGLALILARTPFGRSLYAIGGNERSARLAGLPVRRSLVTVYTLAGMLAGGAGVALVVRTSSGVPHVGAGWELDAIAAITIGGARLFGGEGKLLNAMAGVLIYQSIANVMNLVEIDPFYQDIVKALIILTVVGLSVRRGQSARKG